MLLTSFITSFFGYLSIAILDLLTLPLRVFAGEAVLSLLT